MATVEDLLVRNLRAERLGEYLSFLMAARTFSCVSGFTRSGELRTLETVFSDTPAAAATSRMDIFDLLTATVTFFADSENSPLTKHKRQSSNLELIGEVE